MRERDKQRNKKRGLQKCSSLCLQSSALQAKGNFLFHKQYMQHLPLGSLTSERGIYAAECSGQHRPCCCHRGDILPSIMLQQLFYYSRCKGLHFTCLSPMPHSIPPAVTHLHFQLIVLDLLHCQGHYLKNPTVKGKVGLEGWQHKRKNTSQIVKV